MVRRGERSADRRIAVAVASLPAAVLLAAVLVPAPAALAAGGPWTVTYEANAAQHQPGATGGTVPSPSVHADGSIVVVAAAGTLVRQGFTFEGWNTAADGSGTPYAPGATFTVTADVTLHAQWGIPVAARLFGRTSGGARTEVVRVVTAAPAPSTAAVRGIATVGGSVFLIPSGATNVLREVGFDGVWIADHTLTGALTGAHAGGSGIGDAWFQSRDLTHSSGCLFLRGPGAASTLHCIEVGTWRVVGATVPAAHPLPEGQGWLSGNLIDFPDGRIGAVSNILADLATLTGYAGASCPSGFHCKVLRLYTPTVTGTGATLAVTLVHSEDMVLADHRSDWPSDNHGIATDGTYLYQSNHRTPTVQNYSTYALQSGGPSYLVFDGGGTGACGADAGVSGGECDLNPGTAPARIANATFFARDHLNNRYLMGDYNGPRFVFTEQATPPPGPGSLRLAMVTQPSGSATSGEVLAQQPAVRLVDGSGNVVAQAGVVVTVSIASGGGTLGGTPTAVTAADGEVSFSDLEITGTAGMRTLLFEAPGVTPVSSADVELMVPAPPPGPTSGPDPPTGDGGSADAPSVDPVTPARIEAGEGAPPSSRSVPVLLLVLLVASLGGRLGGRAARP